MVGYREIAIKVLETEEDPMTPKQIWAKALDMGLIDTKCIKGKTPVATLGSLLLRETNKGKYKGEDSVFEYENSPRRYWLKSKG